MNFVKFNFVCEGFYSEGVWRIIDGTFFSKVLSSLQISQDQLLLSWILLQILLKEVWVLHCREQNSTLSLKNEAYAVFLFILLLDLITFCDRLLSEEHFELFEHLLTCFPCFRHEPEKEFYLLFS
mmetsp:Transcript_1961/g.1424  ORF Transcript_1961/g.1424 Transcript_1961/m.1424 type:complete len:125 (-) Transcript_1961:524-898(-)